VFVKGTSRRKKEGRFLRFLGGGGKKEDKNFLAASSRLTEAYNIEKKKGKIIRLGRPKGKRKRGGGFSFRPTEVGRSHKKKKPVHIFRRREDREDVSFPVCKKKRRSLERKTTFSSKRGEKKKKRRGAKRIIRD